MKKYTFKQYIYKFMKIGDEYQNVEITTESKLDLDGVMNLIGYLIEGADGKEIKVGIREVESDE